MLKVLIVDDDALARTNIKNLFDWEGNGYILCGEAQNGQEAIQIIEEQLPDVVITDISMPGVNGVELIDYLEKNYPHIKKLALSGYDNYDYVRSSLKNGAIDYILKHTLDENTLRNILDTVSKELISDKNEREQKIESRAVLKQKFIRQLINGEVSDLSEIEHKLDTNGLKLDTRNLVLILFELDDFTVLSEKFTAKEISNLISSIDDICDEILKSLPKSAVSHVDGGKFIIFLSFLDSRSDLYIYSLLVTIMDRIKVSIKRYLNVTACFSYSRVYNYITETRKHYKEAELVLEQRFFQGKDTVINDTNDKAKSEQLNLSLSDEKIIISAVKSLEKSKVEKCIKDIFDRIKSEKYTYNSIQMICSELINIINRVSRETELDIRLIYNNNEVPYNQMKRLETIDEVKCWILQIYNKLIGILSEARFNTNYNEYTRKAMAFIMKNHASNISLNDAADYIGINSSYLSRVFKDDCGMGFVEYLNNTRVEKAKQIIECGNTKLKDVSQVVGFNNYPYFTKVFKDIINMTPQEYEKKCRG